MDFALSEEQALLQDEVRRFVERECPPSRVRQLFDDEAGFDAGLWKGLAELGLAGIALPEWAGGAGRGVLELALVAEELGRGAVPAPFLEHALAGLAIAWGGDEAQQRRWLPALASGEQLGTVAFAEPGPRDPAFGWEPATWRVRLDAGGRLRGAKRSVPSGSRANLVVVGTQGGGLSVCEPAAGGLGFTTPCEDLDRTRRSADLALDGVAGVALARGAAAAPRVRDAGLALLAADAFGAAHALVRASAAYAGTRQQFGRPLAGFQAVKHQLADMALDVEPLRGLVWYAAHAQDALPERAPRAAALAKAHVTERATAVARRAVEIHGGLGFTWECDVQVFYKRIVFDRLFLGTPELHRERAAALAGWGAEHAGPEAG